MIPEHYRELDEAAVFFAVDRNWIAVEGPDRVDWLQGMVSNDIGRLRPGQGCLAAHLTPQGKVLAMLTVLADTDRLWLLTERQRGSMVADALGRLLIMEDATIEDQTERVRATAVVGHRAGEILADVFGGESMPADRYDHRMAGDLRVVRTRIGFDVVGSEADIDQLAHRFGAAAVSRGKDDLYDLACIEAGLPRWGVDVTDAVTLPELGEESIDYTKGCYIGQEVVAKIKYIGHVNRRLVGLRLDGPGLPGPGPIHREGRDVGRLTSNALSPASGGVIGLGFVRPGVEREGTEVEILRDSNRWTGIVATLPFAIR